jgi:hypothetical protein
MSDQKAGLSTGADSGFEAAFLAGQIQSDYAGLVADPQDVLEFELKGALGSSPSDSDRSGCTSTQTPCCPKPKPTPPKPKPGPKKKAMSWFDVP